MVPPVPGRMKHRICDAAAEVLRETKNEAVMWSDDGLLADIAARAGVSHDPQKRFFDCQEKVLSALSKTPGSLIPSKTRHPHKKSWVRIFWLPECAPPWALTRK